MKASVLVVCFAGATAAAEVAAPDGVEFFERRIRPVLAEHCYECHSAEAKKLKGGLRLDTREDLLRGGENGAVVIAGKPEESPLITAIRYHDKDLRMPPPKDDVPRKLADPAIADLTEWVRLGAPMPNVERRTSNIEHRAESHWAFQPRANPIPPPVKDKSWIKTDIDRFILAKLEAAGFHPAPPADPRTLIRRMTFDLTGLPPTPEEAEDFARAPGDLSTLLNRLLGSPHYGERWGRHWLDVARYADTKGYVYGREERFFVHAYAYRDWVVRAFNNDLPYDRFLLLQIAADQLVPPASPDLAAMGFLTGGRRFIGVTRDIIDDRIDAVMRGTMALTVACARCHDHKYDPVPTRDYYSLYGVFNSCAERLVNLGAEPEDKDFVTKARKLSDTMLKRREEAAARLRARVGEYLAAQFELQKYPDEGFDQILTPDDVIPASVRRWRDFLERTKDTADPIFAPWHALKIGDQPAGSPVALNPLVASAFAEPAKTAKEAAERYGKLFAQVDREWQGAIAEAQRMNLPAPTSLPDAAAEALRRFLYDPRSPTTVPDEAVVNNEQFFPTSVCEELWKLQGDVERWLINTPAAPPHALLLVDREPERNPRVFVRGNPARQGEEVPRQFPGVVAGPERHPFEHGSGRLELAQAIVRPDNPLTARVMVNRIWQHHFGSGIVRTPSDFGTRAEAPSHPELLDWLAGEFIKSGWSVKAMHRLIMSSAVYQQSSSMDPGDANADPENRLLAHFPRQRLDFEELRDAMLASSGELDDRIGGKPADLFAAANKRRTIYGLVDRQFLPGTFRVFDFANPDLHIPQRHNTTVPQQALFLLNNAFIAERANAIAQRTTEAAPEERVRQIHRALYQRTPSANEIAAALRFVGEAEAAKPPPPSTPIATAWQYGFGEYDESTHRVKGFQPIPHFTGKAWQGGASWPDAQLGWVQLTAEGGHPGNDLQHAVIRRWTSPRDGAVSISGEIIHEPDAGDGVRAFVVASRHGELKAAALLHGRAEMTAPRVEVQKGDTLDFIVDIGGTLNSDQFLWAPVIGTIEAGSTTTWDAKQEFAGPVPAPQPQLNSWQQYVQILLLANEFSFVD